MEPQRSNYKEIYDLLDQLCKSVLGCQSKETLRQVAQYISNCPNALGSTFTYDESATAANIIQYLRGSDSTETISTIQRFQQLHQILQINCTHDRTRSALLYFLFALANSREQQKSYLNIPNTTSQTNNTQIINSLISTPSPSNIQLNMVNNSSSKFSEMSSGYNKPSFVPTQNGEQNSAMISDRKMENEIVQNAIYACTGIEGNYLKKDVITGAFKFGPNIKSLDVGQAHMLLRLSQLGFHYGLLKSYTDSKRGLCPLGLMGQGFITALKCEITQYIGSVALLEDELNRQRELESQNIPIANNERLTLMKTYVWASPILDRLQWLKSLSEACVEKKGGALATTLYNFIQHGNTQFTATVREMLLAVCGPLYRMLSRWLLEGEINDPHNEFFIECVNEVGPDRLWYDKYRVRTAMLPVFISPEFAHKILVAGKSINYLCQICEDEQPVKGGDELQECIDKNADDIFSLVADTKLHAVINSIYLNTSKRVLDIVMGPHKLLEHLQAMRRYLLLGQGDFIGILIENLKAELDKPAKELYSYDISSIIYASIRSTNAHYDDPEILNHLDVRLMSPCDGDIGWDILTLQYTVRGPLATMLEPSMGIYQILFKPLWRMKHMEFVLCSKIWKEQMWNEKSLRPLKGELRAVFYQLHLITSEMIHFINQMQYYILFEVIECSWVELQERVQQAKALDDILEAHDEFLAAIRRGAFLEPSFGELYQNLEDVYDGIKRLEVWQDKFFEISSKEAESRKSYELEIVASEKEGVFGVTIEKQLQRDQENKIFQQQVNSYQKNLITIGNEYEKAVRSFLLSLNSNNDHNLQLFGIRLDFNEYYKKRDQRLGVPLTFEHMRLSHVRFSKSFSSSRYSTFN